MGEICLFNSYSKFTLPEISGFFTKKNSDVIIYIEYERGCLRWKNSSDSHADGLTGDTRGMQEKRTPAK